MAILNNSNAISTAGGYDINNSLRFRSSASAYLNRTAGSTTNRQTWTWSGWVKRGTLGARQHIFVSANPVVNSSGQQEFQFCFDSSDRIEITGGTSGVGQDLNLTTTQVFRDPSAWYHFVVVADTTQATSSNRMKFYVNGNQVTAFGTAIYPSQNYNTSVNLTGFSHRIGGSGGSYLDAYQAEINFIDGSALTPSSFGETDTTTGSWKPKAYTSTYGTNGFYLKFSDIATTSGSNAGLGKDFSGNANYFNTNNISVTAGTTYDAMTDSPTLTSATVANYPVLNPLIKQGSGSVTEGNLKGAGSSYECWGTMAFPSTGKYYFEYTHNGSTGAGNGPAIGIVGLNKPDEDYGVKYNKNGTKWLNGTNSIAYGASYTTGDVIGVAYDADNNSITFYKNNTSQGATTTASGYTYLPYHFDNSGSGGFLNFGQRPFSYTPPTGFVRLNTYNLPDSTIKKGNTVMDATLWTGTGTNLNVVNASQFKPDFVWIKNRSTTNYHNLFDSVRGVQKALYSNATDAEATETQGLLAFNSNGFNMGTNGGTNGSGNALVGWQWQAGQGSTSSNTNGSITSTVSVNTTAGFSIATFTSTGAAATVGHGLGVAPKMIIVKARNNASGWAVYHASVGNTGALRLDTTAATSTTIDWWRDTSPTSSVFSIGANFPNAYTSVAYCWAEIAGFSKFGSYTGNGSADGPFVYLGFRPKFVLLYNTAGGDFWYILDSARDTYNATGLYLYPNSSNAEGDLRSTYPQDFLSNGFKVRNASFPNANGTNIIYAAFAENPFKNSNAR